MRRVIRIGIIGFLGLAVLGMVLSHIHADKFTPTQATQRRMELLRLRILEHARTHGQLPTDLSALSLEPANTRLILDVWRRKINYEVDASGTVTLRSFGKDGLPGGSGRNADIVVSFRSRRPDGSWSEVSDKY